MLAGSICLDMKRSMVNRWLMYVKCVELGLAGGIFYQRLSLIGKLFRD